MEQAIALKEKGNKEFAAGNYLKAIEYYSQAIQLHPDPTYYSNRATCFLNLKKYHSVIEDCKKAIEFDDKPAKPYYRLAQAYASLGELKQAFEILKNGCEKHPSEPNMRREYDNIQILLSYRDALDGMIEKDNLIEALKKVNSLLEKCEMDYDLLIKKAELLCKTNDPKGAKTLLSERENFFQAKSNTKFIILSAMTDRYLNKIDESKKKLQLAAKFDQDSDELKRELKHLLLMESIKSKANSAFSSRKFEESIKLFEECYLLDPYNAMWKSVILSNKASCYMALKDIKTALELMRQSTELDPTNAKNFYKRGKLEKDLKDWESALNSMRKAKSMDSTLTIDTDIKQISDELKKINQRNYYEIMGVSQQATPEEIKKAYKQLVLKYHPDRHSGNKEEQEKAEKIFKEVNEANAVLSDPKKRQQYDDNGCKKVEDDGFTTHGFGHGFGIDPSEIMKMFFTAQPGHTGAGGTFRRNGRQNYDSHRFFF